MDWEKQWLVNNQSEFGAESQTVNSTSITTRKVNVPLLAAGVVGLITAASIVSSVVTAVSTDKKEKKERHKALARKAGWYVK